jgi:hypothetical protein
MASESPLPHTQPSAPNSHLFVPSVPPTPSRQPFNPGWVTATIAFLSALVLVVGTYRDVADLRSWQKEIVTWKNTRDVADAEIRKDVAHIKTTVDEIKIDFASQMRELKMLLSTGTVRK